MSEYSRLFKTIRTKPRQYKPQRMYKTCTGPMCVGLRLPARAFNKGASVCRECELALKLRTARNQIMRMEHEAEQAGVAKRKLIQMDEAREKQARAAAGETDV